MIRKLDAQNGINELTRSGYRHTDKYGIIMNAQVRENPFFIKGNVYRAFDGRVMMVSSGWMDLEIDLVVHHLVVGDIAVMLPDTLVMVGDVSDDCLLSGIIFRRMPLGAGGASFVSEGNEVAVGRLNRYLELILDHFTHTVVSSGITDHLFDALILDMLGMHTSTQTGGGGGIMQRFLQLLSDEGRVKRPIEFYADRLCITPNYLSRLVRRESDMTVLQWIDRALVREAKVLLHHTQMSVSEIAEKLGFATPSFFIRFFRQQTGQTPLQYRKQG